MSPPSLLATGGASEEVESGIADTSSPRSTLTCFRNDCDAIYRLIRDEADSDSVEISRLTARVLSCLDLSQQPEYLRTDRGKEAAVCLKEILDRIPVPPEHEIPGFDEVQGGENTPPLEEWRIPRSKIALELIEEGTRKGDYLFSAETVATAPRYYGQIESLPYKREASKGFYQWFLASPGPWLEAIVNHLPESIRTTFWGKTSDLAMARSHDHPPARILPDAGTLLLRAEALVGPAGNAVRSAISWRSPTHSPPFRCPWQSVPSPVNNCASPGDSLLAVRFSATMIFLLGLVLVIMAAGGRIGEILVSNPKVNTKGLDAQLLRIMCRLVALIAATIVFLQGGQYLGIPLSTLLASAGVGGFAFALAAQDSLKNFFGSMMIILDKPFRVGERIVVADSTARSRRSACARPPAPPNRPSGDRPQRGNGAQPNREYRAASAHPARCRPPPPTRHPADKARRAVEITEEILDDHEGMKEEFPPRIALSDIRDDALTIKMIYWYHPPNYWDYLASCQQINLEIKERFEAEGLSFAPPTSTTRLVTGDESANSPGSSPEDSLPTG